MKICTTMEYDSSELYYEKSEGSECTPSQLTNQKSGKKSRNLEDRVREYTGYMQVCTNILVQRSQLEIVLNWKLPLCISISDIKDKHHLTKKFR